uniref:Uncharacterized protein n=1 Tax=Arundo donax TaxID=35708 RepID=A0A0A9E9C5_ARUDO
MRSASAARYFSNPIVVKPFSFFMSTALFMGVLPYFFCSLGWHQKRFLTPQEKKDKERENGRRRDCLMSSS